MLDQSQYDVFLSHSAKDKAVVRPLAQRLRQEGLKVWLDEWVLRPGASLPAKLAPPSLRSFGGTGAGLEHSRVLARPAVAGRRRRRLCLSAQAFGSDWAQLACLAVAFRRRRKAGTFRFRDPLNQERRNGRSDFDLPTWNLKLNRG